MKPTQTVKLSDTERTALAKFLNVKCHTEFPKQQSEKFCRIVNMLQHPCKKEFTVAEFKMIRKEVEIAAAIINRKQARCIKIMAERGKGIITTNYIGNAKPLGK